MQKIVKFQIGTSKRKNKRNDVITVKILYFWYRNVQKKVDNIWLNLGERSYNKL